MGAPAITDVIDALTGQGLLTPQEAAAASLNGAASWATYGGLIGGALPELSQLSRLQRFVVGAATNLGLVNALSAYTQGTPAPLTSDILAAGFPAATEAFGYATTATPVKGAPTNIDVITVPNANGQDVKIIFNNPPAELGLSADEIAGLKDIVGRSHSTQDINIVKTQMNPAPIRALLGAQPFNRVQYIPTTSQVYGIGQGSIAAPGEPTAPVYTVQEPSVARTIRTALGQGPKITQTGTIDLSGQVAAIRPDIGPQPSAQAIPLDELQNARLNSIRGKIYQLNQPQAAAGEGKGTGIVSARGTQGAVQFNVNPEGAKPVTGDIQNFVSSKGIPYTVITGQIFRSGETGLPEANYRVTQLPSRATEAAPKPLEAGKPYEGSSFPYEPATGNINPEVKAQLDEMRAEQEAAIAKAGALAEVATQPPVPVRTGGGQVQIQNQVPLVGPGSASRYSFVPQVRGGNRVVYRTESEPALSTDELLARMGRVPSGTALSCGAIHGPIQDARGAASTDSNAQGNIQPGAYQHTSDKEHTDAGAGSNPKKRASRDHRALSSAEGS